MIGGIEPFSLSYWPANHWVFSGLEGSNDDTHTHTHWRMESAGTHTLRDRCRNSKRPNQPASYQCFQHLLPPSLYDTHTHTHAQTLIPSSRKTGGDSKKSRLLGIFVMCIVAPIISYLSFSLLAPTHPPTRTHIFGRGCRTFALLDPWPNLNSISER